MQNKYRRTSSFQVSPRTEQRPALLSQGDGSATNDLKLHAVDASLATVLRQHVAGGCEQNVGYVTTLNEIIIFTVHPVALGCGSHSDKPVVRCTYSLLDFPTSTPPDPSQVTVLFPYVLSQTLPPTAIVIFHHTNDIFIAPLDGEKTLVSYAESGLQYPEAFLSSHIKYASSMYSKGVVLATGLGEVYSLNIDPVAKQFQPMVHLTQGPPSEAGLMASFMSLATSTKRVVSGLFAGGQNAAHELSCVVPDVKKVIYNPVPQGREGDNSVFVVAESGRVIELIHSPETDAEMEHPVTVSLVLGRAEDITDLAECGTNFKVVDACLAYRLESLDVPVLNLLVEYSCAQTGQKVLALCKIICGTRPIRRAPITLGFYAAESYRIFIEEHNASQEEEDEQSTERLVIVAQYAERTQVIKVVLPGRGGRLDSANIQFSDISGCTAVLSGNTAPQPEKMCLLTNNGQYASQPLCSLAFSALRRSGCGQNEANGNNNTVGARQGHLQLVTGNVCQNSLDVINEPVVETARWDAMSDAHDRTSTMLLRRVREKMDQAEFILEAVAKRSSDPQQDLRRVADNYEKAAVSLAFRELQTHLYEKNDLKKWMSSEAVSLLSDYAATITPRPEIAGLHLTPLQTFYTETRQIDGFFRFFAQFIQANGNFSLEYMGFVSRIVWDTLSRLSRARQFVSQRVDTQDAADPEVRLGTPPSVSRVASHRSVAALCAEVVKQGVLPQRWTHAKSFTEPLRAIAEILKRVVSPDRATVLANTRARTASTEHTVEALEQQETTAAIRRTLQLILVWVAQQELEEVVVSSGYLARNILNERTGSLVKQKREQIRDLVKRCFCVEEPVESEESYSKRLFEVSVSDAKVFAESFELQAAKDVARDIDDYHLLLSLVLLQDASPSRRAELQAVHDSSPIKFFEAAIELYRTSRSHQLEDLMMLPEEVRGGPKAVSILQELVKENVPDGFVHKSSLLGAISGGRGITPGDEVCVGQMLQGARSVLAVLKANHGMAVGERLRRLKAAKFSCEMCPEGRERNALLDDVHAALTPLRVQTELLRCASATALKAEELLSLTLTAPAEGASSWDEVSPSEGVLDYTGHKLAWAFPLVPLCSEIDAERTRHEVWSKVLHTPTNWWEGAAFERVLDKVCWDWERKGKEKGLVF